MRSDKKASEAFVVKIKGNSIEDGPGIRSVIFLKGCNLDCLWCHNPESKKTENELFWDDQDCIAHGECMDVCKQGAISPEFSTFVNRNLCTLCYQCVPVCPSHALRPAAKSMSVDELINNVIRYKTYYDTSGGGVTLSGGEPALHPEFSSSLLKGLQGKGVHTLVQTAGLFDLADFETQILPYTNVVYFDIKLIDPEKHQELCGVKNERILENFLSLHEKSKTEDFEIMPRTPLVPGMTDTKKNITEMAQFYKKHKIPKVSLLSYNPIWLPTLNKLGQRALFQTDGPMGELYDTEKEKEIKDYFIDQGIKLFS